MLFPRACSVSCDAGRGWGGGVVSIPVWKHSLNGKSVPEKWCNSFKPSKAFSPLSNGRLCAQYSLSFQWLEQCTGIFQARPPKVHGNNFAQPKAMGPRIIIILPWGGRHRALNMFFQAFPEQKLIRMEVSEGKSLSLRGWGYFHNPYLLGLEKCFHEPLLSLKNGLIMLRITLSLLHT